MKTMTGMLPWALAVLAIGGAIWWLLSRDIAAGRWLLAALLVGHGLVHVMFLVPPPAATDDGTEWPFDMARSWGTRAGLDLGLGRGIGTVLIPVTAGAFGLAALSTVGLIIPSGWWQPTIALGATASAAMLLLYFEPQLVLGLGIDAVLLWVVATNACVP